MFVGWSKTKPRRYRGIGLPTGAQEPFFLFVGWSKPGQYRGIGLPTGARKIPPHIFIPIIVVFK
jgi:hypothetical protein